MQAQTPLAELAEKIDSRLSYHAFEGDDEETIRDSFDKRSKKLEREIQKAKTRLERFEAPKDRNATSEDPPEIAAARAEIKDKTEKIGEIDDEIALSLDLLEVASDPATKSNDLTGMVIGPSTKAGLFVRLEEVILEIEDEEASLVEKRVNGLETLRAQESRENLLSDWIARGRLPR